MLEKRNALRRRIAAVRKVQAIYMPCVPQLIALCHHQHRTITRHQSSHSPGSTRTTSAAQTDYPPEEQSLFLTSELSVDQRAACVQNLLTLEERLRDAQLYNALDKLRIQLHIKSRMLTFKERNVRHQRPNTCAQRQLEVNESKIKVFAEKYRAAWRAKLSLAGEGTWQQKWQWLRHKDVRIMSAEDDPVNRKAAEVRAAGTSQTPMLSEGRRKTSWIWLGSDKDEEDVTGMADGEQIPICVHRV
jgi:hypothetical protein